MTTKAAKAIATKIADALFVNYESAEALRLKLIAPDGRDLGGWCRQAVIDRVEAILHAAEIGG